MTGQTEGTTATEFRFSPRSIQELIVKEFKAAPERVTKERPYPELFDLRSSNKDGRGNTLFIVKRDGTVEEMADRTSVRQILSTAMENALVIRYYSSRGDTFKLYMGREISDIAPKSAAQILLDDDEA